MAKMKPIQTKQLEKMRQAYLENDKARIVRNALTNTDIKKISNVFEAQSANPNLFSIDIETMPVTNQMNSGRCWIFSALNVMREIIAKKYKIENFELSQNYVAFYDKLEKVNYFLESVLQEIDKPYNDETLRYLLTMGIGDGGQWDMLVSLIKKYGLCPKTAMPETYQSSHTFTMTSLLNRRLRKFVADAKALIKKGKKQEVPALKEECLNECYGMICSCFGVPPQKFTFEYYDKKKNYHAHRNLTPQKFYEEYLKEDLDNYVGIIHGPTKDKPFYKMYTVKYLGNVVDGNPISFLNLPMKDFKELLLKQLKDKNLVWFGCDCSVDGNRETGLWDDQQFAYGDTFDMQLDMSKEEMLDTRQSAMNHAMVFTGVNLVNGKPTRWKIENSWGDKVANKGYYICSDTWFEKYVYEAVVHKKYLTAKQKAALKTKPKELEPWDPFGSLAD
ncbi:MAG: C1 family peptidase [Solobacterium sp.]|nr:C1 family peptidase [Solobacterium sp.]